MAPFISRREFVSRATALAAVSAMRLSAQEKPNPLAFEVFSIRPSDASAASESWRILPDGLSIKASDMWTILMLAYFPLSQWSSQTFKGAPDWIEKDHFDVLAKVSAEDLPAWQAHKQDPNSKPLLETMLQAALVERCKLVVRHVPKEAPAFALELGKHGLRLTPTPQDATPPADSYKFIGGATVSRSTENGRAVTRFYGATLAQLISFLTLSSHAPIMDRTGLAGKYDFALMLQEGDGGDVGLPRDPGLTWDIEALGLHIATSKTSVDTITIDHIERPTPN